MVLHLPGWHGEGMGYQRPSVVRLKVYNPLAVRLGLGGASALVVRGRLSGVPRSTPVIPVQLDGQLHVVSTRGEADWVRNLRAAGRCELRGRHQPGSYFAVELPVDQRAAVVAGYRVRAGRSADGCWARLPDDADHPVFRLTMV
jgi:deazaflavin-dependent oxidoreductase (nitroreductase family)